MKILCAILLIAAGAVPGSISGTVVGAHNCYEEEGKYADRPDRALSAGFPLAIEEDLVWYTDPSTHRSRSLIAHGRGPWITGREPGLHEYFFERLRPIVEKELASPHPDRWPLITLFLDIKTNEPEHLQSIFETVSEYRSWLATSMKSGSDAIAPLTPGPIQIFALSNVLSPVYGAQPEAESTIQQAAIQRRIFYDSLQPGERLLVFGATASNFDASIAPSGLLAKIPADKLLSNRANNYQRFWISSWDPVEEGGQTKAGAWNAQREKRLRELTDRAHSLGLKVIFYCLDGTAASLAALNGWSAAYNFGALSLVAPRWKACQRSSVDFVITDQYEDLARALSFGATSR